MGAEQIQDPRKAGWMVNTRLSNPNARYPWLRTFLSFGGVSGLGWLLDLSLLLFQVAVLHVPELAANLVSSLVAAGTVFLISRRFIFASVSGNSPLRAATYLLYTVVVVLIASAALQWIANMMSLISRHHLLKFDAAAIAAMAKVIVTPPQLLLNFFMSRLLNEHPLKG